MAWTTPDWQTAGDQLAAINARIAEVEGKIGPDRSAAPGSVTHAPLVEYLKALYDQRNRLERLSTTAAADFTRGRAL